jgi:hypothetical protein
LAAAGLGYPGDAGLGLGTLDQTVGCQIGACPARSGSCS